MESISELEFKVQILARCMGSALGLGRPTRIEIHYCTPQNRENQRPAADRDSGTGSLATSASQSSSLVSEWVTGAQGQSAVYAA
ncbi:MAG: hypothetical protein SNJ68_08550 [Cyanobacteriota bacterium]